MRNSSIAGVGFWLCEMGAMALVLMPEVSPHIFSKLV